MPGRSTPAASRRRPPPSTVVRWRQRTVTCGRPRSWSSLPPPGRRSWPSGHRCATSTTAVKAAGAPRAAAGAGPVEARHEF
eukprot:6047728-Lingulodinium_polyedra.AAC.1